MIFRSRFQTLHIFVNHITSEGRIVWLLYIPGYIYFILLLFHAVWQYFPNYWDSVYHQSNYPLKPLVPPIMQYSSSHLPPDVTVVTAFFDLGTFQKGKLKTFTFKTYTAWMAAYGKLNNSVIVYTDSEEVRSYILELREDLPPEMTRVFVVTRDDLWSFKLAPKIMNIYDQPGYPKHHPNTVNQFYSCAMHAKYEILQKVIESKLLQTKYIAWVDIGYFRDQENDLFVLRPPENFKENHIAFTQIDSYYSYLTPEEIIKGNSVWIAGGLFLGVPEYLMVFIEDYKATVEDLIKRKLMNTDQQVLYCMYSPQSGYKPRLPLQLFYNLNRQDWFFLGELCREPFEKVIRGKRSLNYYLDVLP